MVERLAPIPGAASLLCGVLQVAPSEVDADAVTIDVIERLGGINAGAAFADGDNQLDLIMEFLGFRRVGDSAAGIDNRISGLAEEEGRLPRGVAAHLARVGGVVSADAENAAYGEASLHTVNCDARNCRCGENKKCQTSSPKKEESSSFLKKRTKKLLLYEDALPERTATAT